MSTRIDIDKLSDLVVIAEHTLAAESLTEFFISGQFERHISPYLNQHSRSLSWSGNPAPGDLNGLNWLEPAIVHGHRDRNCIRRRRNLTISEIEIELDKAS